VQLIEAGASLDDVDRADLCSFAATSIDFIQVLKDHDVRISDLRDQKGLTPLHVATCNRAHVHVLSKLIECGVDLEARTSEQWMTCTGLATMTQHDELRLFVLAGANVNCTDADGEPLLHKSVLQKKYPCLMLLLAAGADVTARDRNGRTACLVAAREQSLFVDLLVAAGADLDVADDSGETPRVCMAECGMTIDPDQVGAARREIAKVRLDFVRHRALQVCIGLQSRGARCIANLRNSRALVWPIGASDFISSVVGDRDKCETLYEKNLRNSFQFSSSTTANRRELPATASAVVAHRPLASPTQSQPKTAWKERVDRRPAHCRCANPRRAVLWQPTRRESAQCRAPTE
jgi:hypothetical protein